MRKKIKGSREIIQLIVEVVAENLWQQIIEFMLVPEVSPNF